MNKSKQQVDNITVTTLLWALEQAENGQGAYCDEEYDLYGEDLQAVRDAIDAVIADRELLKKMQYMLQNLVDLYESKRLNTSTF